MKKILVSILLMLALLAIATPASADQKVRLGTRFNLLTSDPTTFTAGDPFHIAHGHALDISTSTAIGIYDFKLEVDGVLRDEDFVERSVVSGDPYPLSIFWVFNFPNGMTEGSHTFTGHWFSPCQQAVDGGLIPGPCSTPNEKVEFLSLSMTVGFSP